MYCSISPCFVLQATIHTLCAYQFYIFLESEKVKFERENGVMSISFLKSGVAMF